MRTSPRALITSVALWLVGMVAAHSQNPLDETRSLQTFVVQPAKEVAGAIILTRKHGTGELQREPTYGAKVSEDGKTLRVYTRTFREEPRYEIEIETPGVAINVYTVDAGLRRDEPSYLIERVAGNQEFSGYRIRRGEKAVFRSAVVLVEPENNQTLVYKTGTGNERLARPFRKIDHDQVAAVSSFTFNQIPATGVAGIIAVLDVLKGR